LQGAGIPHFVRKDISKKKENQKPKKLAKPEPKCCSHFQDSKLEGVIPSPGPKLYLVWNQVVGRIEKEKALDSAKQGTRWGFGGAENDGFCRLT
jgi:hypothetical protein